MHHEPAATRPGSGPGADAIPRDAVTPSPDFPPSPSPARPGPALPRDRVPVSTYSPAVAGLLQRCIQAGGSDLHIHPMSPPIVRVNGELRAISEKIWDPETTESVCRALCSDEQWKAVQRTGTVDFGIAHTGGERFRASVLHQQLGYAAVLRLIPSGLLSFTDIGLPEQTILDLLRRPRGLILVTGPTGSGKSTTLATMVDWVNTHQSRHIITVEDPVEFRHSNKRGLVTQREVGRDVPGFAEAMRRALRQDPDVIMLGEMRDLETISAALTAAETGHLVLGTLHTTGSAKTINRVVDAFPSDHQAQVRVQLAMSLLAVISQVLMPSKEGGRRPDGSALPLRVAGLEVMAITPAIANLIRGNEINRIQDVIQTSRNLGMFTLDAHLQTLVQQGVIDSETALAFAQDPPTLERLLGIQPG